jgi:hypothetical protein
LLDARRAVVDGVVRADGCSVDDTWARSYVSARAARAALVERYAWAVPDEGAIDLCVRCSPLVEIGAGSGYWAAVVTAAGGDVVAYDNGTLVFTGRWHDVRRGSSQAASRHADRTLLLCWPPYQSGMALNALRRHAGAGGQRVIYVGEGHGGRTATDAFHDALAADYVEVAEHHIPQWPYIHDVLWVYERRSGGTP